MAPRLDAVIRRMLSLRPEERGTATEWPQEDLAAAEELGHRARRRKREVVHAAVEADAAKQAEAERQKAETRTRAAERVERGEPRVRGQPRLLWLVASVVGALVLWFWDMGPLRTEEEPTVAQRPRGEEQQDGGSSHLGDTALMSVHSTTGAPTRESVALEVPPKPLPGQLKPDAKGQCRKGEYAINGGCWLKVDLSDPGDCKAIRNGYEFKQGCFTPIFPPTRESTSAPMKPAAP